MVARSDNDSCEHTSCSACVCNVRRSHDNENSTRASCRSVRYTGVQPDGVRRAGTNGTGEDATGCTILHRSSNRVSRTSTCPEFGFLSGHNLEVS